jgi:predicted N-acyltransferase
VTIEVTVLRGIDEIPAAEWDALSPDGSPFLEHAWLSCLEEAGCVGARRGWSPMHLVLREAGALVGAVPCYLKDNSEGEFVFDWSWADFATRAGIEYYPKLVCAVPFTPVGGDRVLVAQGRERAPIVLGAARALAELRKELGLSGVHVLFPHEPEAMAFERAGWLRRVGVQFQWQNRGATGSGYRDWDDYLASFNSKKRHQIRRERAQLEKDGVTIETLAPDALTPDVVEAMFGFYTSTVDKFHWGRRYLNRRFFDLVAARFAKRLSWVVAKKDGAMIAGAFNVKKGKVLYGRYWGNTIDLPFLHFNVCYYHGVAQCLAEGLERFEPGAGGEHKRARGFAPTVTHSAHLLGDARLRGPIAAFLAREREAVLRFVENPDAD